MKKFPWYLNAFFLFCLAYAVCMASCATVPCLPAHEVMRDKGVVLECRRYRYLDTGELVDRCLISTPKGTVTKTVFAHHCGL